ncbi:MAG TPA: hypothetical protein VM677_25630 [Actinokineospora sp.]|nr:hypothetical protein [Actinokineospora sp.]
MTTALIALLLLWHPYVLSRLLPDRTVEVRVRPLAMEIDIVITRM